MTIATQPKTYTAEEYLAFEVQSERRHEYRNGKIVEIQRGTPEHNQVIVAINASLHIAIDKQAHRIFLLNQRLWISEPNLYTYPDIMVTSRPVELKPGRKDTVMNPILLAEVLSDSTQGYDRGDKFAAYRTIPTFQEYLLIAAQDKPHVEQYTKQAENQWLLTEHRGLDKTITLSSLNIEITLADIYEAIAFDVASE